MSSVLSVLHLFVVLHVILPAQSVADFAGTWGRDEARSESQAYGVVGPITVVIEQTATQLTIDSRSPEQNLALTFNLNGSPNRDEDGRTSLLQFEGGKLVTKTSRFVQTPLGRWWVSTIQTRSLSDDGQEMTVETITNIQHGYEAGGGAPSGKARDVFVRKPGS